MAEPAQQTLGADAPVRLRSARFGEFEIPADRVLDFPSGLIGFPNARRFTLLEPERLGSPFRCLVDLDTPELAFVVCDAAWLWPGYASDVPLPEGARPEDVALLAIVTVPADPRAMTANLMAPLVIDVATRRGQQLVLDGDTYGIRHRLLD